VGGNGDVRVRVLGCRGGSALARLEGARGGGVVGRRGGRVLPPPQAIGGWGRRGVGYRRQARMRQAVVRRIRVRYGIARHVAGSGVGHALVGLVAAYGGPFLFARHATDHPSSHIMQQIIPAHTLQFRGHIKEHQLN
jgi:hypothetical protein